MFRPRCIVRYPEGIFPLGEWNALMARITGIEGKQAPWLIRLVMGKARKRPVSIEPSTWAAMGCIA
jgi:hypothetical protein